MHHYCTYTCEILPSENANRELWKVAIPEAASSYEFLMHGLLALGALHYAFIHPDKRRDYNLISTHYQNLMLPYFAASLNSINEENCEAYFLLATLISVLSLCWVTHSDTLERIIGPSDVAQSFMFFQGVKGILDFQPMDKWRQSGSLAHLLQPPVKSGQSVVQSRYLARLDRVTGLARQLPATLEVINSQTACILALESLRATYNLCRNVEEKPGSPWRWAIYLPDLFLELMGKGEPTSLIILAHFSALARLYERKNWVREGWSVSVITMVERNLDPESQEWIKWPRRSIMEEIDIAEESLE
ncbi:hypothetical protein NM208_g2496 [Fusarium decemcellulare]|uniref:Uncharacterized protein n=1 Tax=Fusarium decemcellulare TaxID=57161 RepID=A0ACC1SSF3_9HYPO|nr:hypothetical protein NM208_g2496 [Fusarium decemcellulare]